MLLAMLIVLDIQIVSLLRNFLKSSIWKSCEVRLKLIQNLNNSELHCILSKNHKHKAISGIFLYDLSRENG